MKRCILHYLFRKTNKLFPFILYLTVCCAVYVAPALGQGELVARKLGSTSAAYGYYEYLPNNYDQKNKHPVIIFLSGIGEKGNGTTDLDKVLKHGPTKLIKNGSWPGSRPFIVIAPQSASGFPSPDGLHEFINYIIKSYKVDASRVYLTGLSAGGISTWNYLGVYQDQIAAAIPICGDGKSVASKAGCDFNNIAIWAFHGDSDPTVNVNGSIMAVESINACSHKPSPLAKVTIYPGVGHDSWTRTYDLSGINSNTDSRYSPFNKNIYDWLLTYAREDTIPPPPSSNQPPVADAGNDISASQSATKVVLNGSGSYDPDGNIVAYSWTKIAGPSASLSGAGSSQLILTNLATGTYNFKLTVKDENGISNSDEVVLTVNADNDENGLTYRYYEGNWNSLPDFSKLNVVKSGKVSSFSLNPRSRNDNFGFRFDGFIHISTAGEYTFYLSSDDGSSLYIDARQVIDNDGLHGERERTGKITLLAGYHPIKVKYFEKTGNEILLVKYSGPGVGKQKLPNDKLFISKGTDATVAVNARSEQVTAENTLLESLEGGLTKIASVYPNPVEDKIHVRFTESEVGEINCKLFNYTGTDYQVSVENMQYTDRELVIDVSQWNLSAGIYLLQVTYHQVQQKFRIIKR